MRKAYFLFVLTTFLLFSCGKDSDIFIPNEQPGTERLVASVLGIVVDQQGNPVVDADVWLENNHVQTNDLGLFVFGNLEMPEDAYIRVDKPGYFHGSRRFYPQEGNTSNVRIHLLSSAPVGSFSSSGGGTIQVAGGSRLIFPVDAISTASGSPYAGPVNVAAVPLSTGNPDLLSQMPGDLVGLDDDQQYRALGSFGMIAVELTDNDGNLLQVKDGMKVTIEFPIADAQQGTAPSTIPLWYFDEATGFWKEEGEATRNGDKYVMEVGHFSFWNCDAPFALITLTGSVVYSNGEPAEFVLVCVDVPGLNTSSGGVTDSEGIFEGKVPANQELIITVKDHNGCEIILSDPITVGPFSDDVTIPPITIDFQSGELTTITGALVDCDGEPVEEGIVQISFGNQSRYIYLDSTNTFEYTFYNCDEGPVTVIGYDYLNEKESLPVTFDHAPTIDFGTISVCEELTEYLNVHADGQTIAFQLPDVFLYTQGLEFTRIQGVHVQDSSAYFFANIPGQGLGTYTIDGMNGGGEVFLDLGFGNGGRLNPGIFTFTYWGDEGDFIQGTMTGTYIEINWGTQEQMEYPFTGEFKILRD